MKKYSIQEAKTSHPDAVLFLLRNKSCEIFWYHVTQIEPEGEFEILDAREVAGEIEV